MNDAGKLLENPVVRIVAAVGLMVIVERAIFGLLLAFVDLTESGESLFFEFLWNAPRAAWLAAAIVLVGWLALSTTQGLDQTTVGGAAAGFVFVAFLMENLRVELPDVLRDLYDFLPPVLLLVGAGIGLLKLLEVSPSGAAAGLFETTSAPAPSSFASAPAPSPMPMAAPAPASAPTPAPLPDDQPAAGWLPDPRGEAELRYWDGSAWTDHVHNS